jgi:hypothetical protein
MKQFYTLKSALNYIKKCPICDKNLSINDRNLAAYIYNHKDEHISFYLDQRDQDVVTININTDKIESIVIKQSYSEPLYPKNYNGTYNGTFIHSLNIDCKDCCQYSYILQIHLNLQEIVISKICLNSEFINISDEIIHEVKNSYSTEQTIYTCFDKDGSSKTIILPLVPLDLKNPRETVGRIRKLLIFS